MTSHHPLQASDPGRPTRRKRHIALLAVLFVGCLPILLVALIGWSLPHEKPPRIAENMELSIANEEWPPRLARQFPLGTAEAELVATLGSQGFAIDRVTKTAKANWADGFCNNEVDVVWRSDSAGKLTSVGGRYFPVCP